MKKLTLLLLLLPCLLFFSCSDGGELDQIQLTVVESMTKCDAVTKEHFFAYDSDGEWYKVVWYDTDGIKEGDSLTVYYKEITEISYETGYPDGYTPNKQIIAKKVK